MENITFSKEQYNDLVQIFPNLISLLNLNYDNNEIKYTSESDYKEIFNQLKILNLDTPVRGGGAKRKRKGGGRKRSHKKIPYGLISSKKKQRKNSLKNNYQNSIIKTKKI